MDTLLRKFCIILFIQILMCFNLTHCKRKDRMYKDSSHSNTSGDGSDNIDKTTSGLVPISRCRHNYHESTEASMNKQINLYQHAALVYSSMGTHFSKCDISLPGFNKFFMGMSTTLREKSEGLMNYQTLRGGDVVLRKVQAPATGDWGSGLEAMSHALEIEKSINQALLQLYKLAIKFDDTHAANYLMTTYLAPQVENIFKISTYITNLERVGPGLGEYLFDKLPQN